MIRPRTCQHKFWPNCSATKDNEAITYRSRFGKKGYNVVIFNLDDADPVDGWPYEVKKIKVAAERVGNAWTRGVGV